MKPEPVFLMLPRKKTLSCRESGPSLGADRGLRAAPLRPRVSQQLLRTAVLEEVTGEPLGAAPWISPNQKTRVLLSPDRTSEGREDFGHIEEEKGWKRAEGWTGEQ